MLVENEAWVGRTAGHLNSVVLTTSITITITFLGGMRGTTDSRGAVDSEPLRVTFIVLLEKDGVVSPRVSCLLTLEKVS